MLVHLSFSRVQIRPSLSGIDYRLGYTNGYIHEPAVGTVECCRDAHRSIRGDHEVVPSVAMLL